MGSVHQFPAKGNQGAAGAAAEVTRALRRAVDAPLGVDATFAQREQLALALANAATRQFLQDDLETIAERQGAHVEVDGRLYQRHERGTVRYYTLCGGMDPERWTYREVGVRNGPAMVPLDLEAGIVEQATPALGYRVALGYAKDPLRSCEEDMRADHRRPPSRRTLERMAKAIGTAARRGASRINARVRCAERLPEGTVAIALGLDRAAVPMDALRQDSALAVGIIQDGAPELWNLLRAGVAAEPRVTVCYEAIDRYHLNERLGEVLRVREPDAATRATRLSQWNDSLDCNDKAIYRIREEIRTAYIDALVVQDETVQKALECKEAICPTTRVGLR